MATVIDTNAYLTEAQAQNNAQFIANVIINSKTGWTANAIAGMLGNFMQESSINFGIYESLDNTSSTNGFGIAQWTPNTKYFDWASSNGYANDHPNGESNRILYELANNIQWVTGRTGYSQVYNITFQQYIALTDPPDYCASVWMANYEGPAPASANEANRKQYAIDFFTGGAYALDYTGATVVTGGGGGGTSSSSSTDLYQLLLSDALNGWKY